MSEKVDLAKVFATLHKELHDAENSITRTKRLTELSGRECIRAHFILTHIDDALKIRWERDGSPDFFDEEADRVEL